MLRKMNIVYQVAPPFMRVIDMLSFSVLAPPLTAKFNLDATISLKESTHCSYVATAVHCGHIGAM